MTVRFGTQVHRFAERMSVVRLLRRLGVNPEAVVVMRNGEMVTRDQTLEAGDEVELIRAISGGAER